MIMFSIVIVEDGRLRLPSGRSDALKLSSYKDSDREYPCSQWSRVSQSAIASFRRSKYERRRPDLYIMNPSPSPMCARPGENMTAEALDHLILHLKVCIKRMRSSSVVPENSSQVWEEYTSDVPGFLEALQERQQQKVTCVQIAKDTALPLLKEVLEGIGSLHWVAFGCTMLAWGIDKLDKQHQNFEGCLDVLTGALFRGKA